jgi:hypothetical protein
LLKSFLQKVSAHGSQVVAEEVAEPEALLLAGSVPWRGGEWRRSLHHKPLPGAARVSVPISCANIYLHYVFDLWVDVWRKKCAQGDVIVVRYADDTVLGCLFGEIVQISMESSERSTLKHGGSRAGSVNAARLIGRNRPMRILR